MTGSAGRFPFLSPQRPIHRRGPRTDEQQAKVGSQQGQSELHSTRQEEPVLQVHFDDGHQHVDRQQQCGQSRRHSEDQGRPSEQLNQRQHHSKESGEGDPESAHHSLDPGNADGEQFLYAMHQEHDSDSHPQHCDSPRPIRAVAHAISSALLERNRFYPDRNLAGAEYRPELQPAAGGVGSPREGAAPRPSAAIPSLAPLDHLEQPNQSPQARFAKPPSHRRSNRSTGRSSACNRASPAALIRVFITRLSSRPRLRATSPRPSYRSSKPVMSGS